MNVPIKVKTVREKKFINNETKATEEETIDKMGYIQSFLGVDFSKNKTTVWIDIIFAICKKIDKKV